MSDGTAAPGRQVAGRPPLPFFAHRHQVGRRRGRQAGGAVGGRARRASRPPPTAAVEAGAAYDGPVVLDQPAVGSVQDQLRRRDRPGSDADAGVDVGPGVRVHRRPFQVDGAGRSEGGTATQT